MEDTKDTRHAGRPSKTDRKQRINVTLSPDTLQELEERIPLKQRSAHIEKLIRKDFGLDASNARSTTIQKLP